MGEIFSEIEDAVAWLTEERWIVFGQKGGFDWYLENNYFKPGTPRNAEFELMIASVEVNGSSGFAIFFRVKDTAENREALRATIAKYYGKRLPTVKELSNLIRDVRQAIRLDVLPKLR